MKFVLIKLFLIDKDKIFLDSLQVEVILMKLKGYLKQLQE